MIALIEVHGCVDRRSDSCRRINCSAGMNGRRDQDVGIEIDGMLERNWARIAIRRRKSRP